MIRVYFMNFGYSDHAEDMRAARRMAKRGGFQCSFWQGDEFLGSWCPIGGFRK